MSNDITVSGLHTQRSKRPHLRCHPSKGTTLLNEQLKLDMKTAPQRTADLVARYMTLTKETLPALARRGGTGWPVQNDHCFQRIVLDTICGGVWYDHIQRPAYRNLTQDQAALAVDLCQEIIAGRADLSRLNNQSLVWRGKRRPAPQTDRFPTVPEDRWPR